MKKRSKIKSVSQPNSFQRLKKSTLTRLRRPKFRQTALPEDDYPWPTAHSLYGHPLHPGRDELHQLLHDKSLDDMTGKEIEQHLEAMAREIDAVTRELDEMAREDAPAQHRGGREKTRPSVAEKAEGATPVEATTSVEAKTTVEAETSVPSENTVAVEPSVDDETPTTAPIVTAPPPVAESITEESAVEEGIAGEGAEERPRTIDPAVLFAPEVEAAETRAQESPSPQETSDEEIADEKVAPSLEETATSTDSSAHEDSTDDITTDETTLEEPQTEARVEESPTPVLAPPPRQFHSPGLMLPSQMADEDESESEASEPAVENDAPSVETLSSSEPTDLPSEGLVEETSDAEDRTHPTFTQDADPVDEPFAKPEPVGDPEHVGTPESIDPAHHGNVEAFSESEWIESGEPELDFAADDVEGQSFEDSGSYWEDPVPQTNSDWGGASDPDRIDEGSGGDRAPAPIQDRTDSSVPTEAPVAPPHEAAHAAASRIEDGPKGLKIDSPMPGGADAPDAQGQAATIAEPDTAVATADGPRPPLQLSRDSQGVMKMLADTHLDEKREMELIQQLIVDGEARAQEALDSLSETTATKTSLDQIRDEIQGNQQQLLEMVGDLVREVRESKEVVTEASQDFDDMWGGTEDEDGLSRRVYMEETLDELKRDFHAKHTELVDMVTRLSSRVEDEGSPEGLGGPSQGSLKQIEKLLKESEQRAQLTFEELGESTASKELLRRSLKQIRADFNGRQDEICTMIEQLGSRLSTGSRVRSRAEGMTPTRPLTSSYRGAPHLEGIGWLTVGSAVMLLTWIMIFSGLLTATPWIIGVMGVNFAGSMIVLGGLVRGLRST